MFRLQGHFLWGARSFMCGDLSQRRAWVTSSGLGLCGTIGRPAGGENGPAIPYNTKLSGFEDPFTKRLLFFRLLFFSVADQRLRCFFESPSLTSATNNC